MSKETEKELMKVVDKIKRYKKGTTFTIPYYQMTIPQLNGMRWVVNKAEDLGLIKSVAISHSLADLRGESGRFCSEETFKRI